MKVLTLDCENTMYKHQTRGEDGFYNSKDRIGSVFCLPQFLVMTGLKWLHKKEAETLVNTSNKEFNRKYIQSQINEADLVVGFNIKHDVLWLRKEGIDWSNVKVHDCQIAEWLLNHQRILGSNSLNDACARYNLPSKLDVIETEYWSKGIDTDEIPMDILSKYQAQDCLVTEAVFLKQMERFGKEV